MPRALALSPGSSGDVTVNLTDRGIAMLFTTRYPPGLFDFAVGINRWGYRLLVYVALMTDRYPPFRLDQGSIDIEGSGATS